MDHVEKIGTCLTIAALIGVLVHSHRRQGHKGNLTGLHMNTSASPHQTYMRGPAYLLSALPATRRKDDFADAVSYWPVGGDPYRPQDGWGGEE